MSESTKGDYEAALNTIWDLEVTVRAELTRLIYSNIPYSETTRGLMEDRCASFRAFMEELERTTLHLAYEDGRLVWDE